MFEFNYDGESFLENSIVCVGAAGIDAVGIISSFPKPDDKIRTSSLTLSGGGNAANTCSAISKLGVVTSLFSRVGPDANGCYDFFFNT